MKAGNYVLTLTNIEGWVLLASQSFVNASSEEIDRKTGGCGPGKIGDWFVPDTMYGESVFLACKIHDWMYGEGETLQDKLIADRVFLWNMTVLIQESEETGMLEGEPLDKVRLRRVMTYFEAVSYGGKGAFAQGETMRMV